MPAARYDVAAQKIASCRCQVRHVEWQEPREIKSKEIRYIRAVMLCRAAKQRL
jgi:hypothetical protein